MRLSFVTWDMYMRTKCVLLPQRNVCHEGKKKLEVFCLFGLLWWVYELRKNNQPQSSLECLFAFARCVFWVGVGLLQKPTFIHMTNQVTVQNSKVVLFGKQFVTSHSHHYSPQLCRNPMHMTYSLFSCWQLQDIISVADR